MPEDGQWLAAGYCRLGSRIMRVDMIERVAALVRAAAREGHFEISVLLYLWPGLGTRGNGAYSGRFGMQTGRTGF